MITVLLQSFAKPGTPSIVANGKAFERFISDHGGHFVQLRFHVVRLQKLTLAVGLLQVGLPLPGKGAKDPAFADPLEIVRLFVATLVSQTVRCRIRIVQNHKGYLGRLAVGVADPIPRFFATRVDGDAGIVGGRRATELQGCHGTEIAALSLDLAVGDGFRRNGRDGFSERSAPDGPRQHFGPVHVGEGHLLARQVAAGLVAALHFEFFGHHGLAKLLVERCAESHLVQVGHRWELDFNVCLSGRDRLADGRRRLLGYLLIKVRFVGWGKHGNVFATGGKERQAVLL